MSRLGRHLLLSFWTHALLVALTFIIMGAGLRYALTRPGHQPTVADLWETAQALLARFPAVVAFFAAAITVGRLRGSGSLVSLPAAGRHLRVVGTWILVGALPFALFAQLVDAFPFSGPLAPASPDTPARFWSGRLATGGLYFAGEPDEAGSRRAAALDIEGERLLFGVLATERAGAGAGELRLETVEEWDLRAGSLEIAARPRGLSTFATVRTPRSLIYGPEAAPLDVLTLGRWLSLEPWRADLRFARDSKLTAGLRVLVLALLGFGLVLRPSPRRVLTNSMHSVFLAAAYLLAELVCGGLGVVGSIPPALAAFLPSLSFGVLGVYLWSSCDLRASRE